jgi:hypothetical protein
MGAFVGWAKAAQRPCPRVLAAQLLRAIAIVFYLVIFALLLWLFLVFSVDAHDSWISRGGYVGPDGLSCCGENDCFVLPSEWVSARADGYHLVVRQVVSGNDETRAEIVPYAEAQPSPDGAYWRCRRPNGTRRCFFAPPPST